MSNNIYLPLHVQYLNGKTSLGVLSNDIYSSLHVQYLNGKISLGVLLYVVIIFTCHEVNRAA